MLRVLERAVQVDVHPLIRAGCWGQLSQRWLCIGAFVGCTLARNALTDVFCDVRIDFRPPEVRPNPFRGFKDAAVAGEQRIVCFPD